MALVPVKFRRAFDIYNGAEVAGFEAQRADELVQTGLAEYLPVEAEGASGEIVAAAEEMRPRRKK